jgi:hypothetical protein
MQNIKTPLCLSTLLATVVLAAACTSDPAQPGPSGSSPVPETSGHAQTTTSEFDGDPCGPASVTEIRDALAVPFDTIAANSLSPDGAPVVIDDAGPGGAAGCEYRLVGDGTDSSEAYHQITVRVVRLASGGPDQMSACEEDAKTDPLAYRILDLADGACAGKGAVLTLLVGANHYTVTAAAIPGRADQTDEDLRLGTLAEAAGTVLAQRLPNA